MNVSILQENLLRALTRTGRVLPAKPQLPILQNILFKAQEGRVSITTTSLETTEVVEIGAKVEKDGGLCVPSRLLTELVTSLPQETIHLTVTEGSLHVICGRTKATIPGIAASEFPPVQVEDSGNGAKLDKKNLVASLSRVLFAAAVDESRPLLTGVKVKKQDGGVVFAATDGYRLSVKRIDEVSSELLDMVVPARALGEVVKVSQEEKEVGHIVLSQTKEGQLVFTIGDTKIMTRLIDGEYPAFEKIIPTTHTTRALLDTESFTRAVKSASIFARDNANIVRMTVDAQQVVVSANTPQVGENNVEVEAKIDGEGGSIAFNSRFLLEFLSNFGEEEVLFEMTGSLNPGVFKPVKDDSYFHIIMPVRVQS